MELSIGQFTRRGPIGALGQVCPLLKGKWISYDVTDCRLNLQRLFVKSFLRAHFYSIFFYKTEKTRTLEMNN